MAQQYPHPQQQQQPVQQYPQQQQYPHPQQQQQPVQQYPQQQQQLYPPQQQPPAAQVQPHPPVTTVDPHFADGICNCFNDMGICAQTCFCGYCTDSNIHSLFDRGTAACDCSACCGQFCSDLCTRGYTAPLFEFGIRRQVLARHGIQEEYADSCLRATCCIACSSCQLQRAMKARQMSPGGVCNGDHAFNKGVPAGVPPQRPYATTLCDCGLKECCDGMFCGPCMLGYMATRLNQIDIPVSESGVPPNLNEAAPFQCKECCLTGYCGGTASTYAMRRDFAIRYGVGMEDCCNACCMAFWCSSCAACQQRREMGVMGHWPGGVCLKEPPAHVAQLYAQRMQQQMQQVPMGMPIYNGVAPPDNQHQHHQQQQPQPAQQKMV